MHLRALLLPTTQVFLRLQEEISRLKSVRWKNIFLLIEDEQVLTYEPPFLNFGGRPFEGVSIPTLQYLIAFQVTGSLDSTKSKEN